MGWLEVLVVLFAALGNLWAAPGSDNYTMSAIGKHDRNYVGTAMRHVEGEMTLARLRGYAERR
jgi:hypothetical protein